MSRGGPAFFHGRKGIRMKKNCFREKVSAPSAYPVRRRIAAAVAAAALSVMLSASLTPALPAFAAPAVTDSVLDPSGSGSITLYKLLENGTDGQVLTGSGVDEGLNSRTGMPGIVFRAKKIADITEMLVTEGDGTLKTGVYYTGLDKAFLAACTRALGSPLSGSVTGEGGLTGFPTQTVINAVSQMQKSDGDGATYTGETLLRDTALGGDVVFAPTDSGGRTQLGSLPLGLYLVAEDESAGSYKGANGEVLAGGASPFLISLPMTSLTAIGDKEAGTVWQYDVTAYPKNSVISTEKYIVSDNKQNTLMATDDRQIGDLITQVITGDAPKLVSGSGDPSDREYRKYVIKDTMSAGLDFAGVTRVLIGGKVSAPAALSDLSGGTVLAKADYAVAEGQGKHSFTVSLTESGLKKLNGMEIDAEVAVVFEAKLNGSAVIAGSESGENSNRPSITWRNKSGLERSTEGTPVRLYTYGLDLTKTGVTDFSAVAFTMRRKDGEELLRWVREKEGVYHLAKQADAGSVTELRPDGKGGLRMRGLDEAVYVLRETKTQSGRTLLASDVEIELSGNDKPDGYLKSATASVGGHKAALKIENNGKSGIAGMTVSNHGQIVLKTGGTGRVTLGGFAAAVLLIAVTVYVRLRRRSQGA